MRLPYFCNGLACPCAVNFSGRYGNSLCGTGSRILIVCESVVIWKLSEMSVAEKPINNNVVDRKSSDYLAQLLNDKKQLQALPNVFVHVEKILDEGGVWFFTVKIPYFLCMITKSVILILFIFHFSDSKLGKTHPVAKLNN